MNANPSDCPDSPASSIKERMSEFPFNLYITDNNTYELDVNLVKIPSTTINILKRPTNAMGGGEVSQAFSVTEMMIELIGTKSHDVEMFLYENVKNCFENDENCSIRKLWQSYEALPEEEGKAKSYKDKIMIAMSSLDQHGFLMDDDGVTSLKQMYHTKDDPTSHNYLTISIVELSKKQKVVVARYLIQLVREFCFSPSPRRAPFLWVRFDDLVFSHPNAIEQFMKLALWGAKHGLLINVVDRVKYLNSTVRSSSGTIIPLFAFPDDELREIIGSLPISEEEKNNCLRDYKKMNRSFYHYVNSISWDINPNRL